MITRVYIDNFRCFSNFEFKPAQINLLLGLNGSGKSSFIDVLDRIVGMVLEGQEVETLFDEADLTRWDSRSEQRFELDLDIEGEVFRYRAVLGIGVPGMTLRDERVTCGRRTLFRYEGGNVFLHRNDGSVETEFPFKGNRSFIAGIEERPETRDLMRFMASLRGLRTFKLLPSLMGPVTHEEQQLLAKDGANFASWYRHISQEHAGRVLGYFEQLKAAMVGFNALALKGSGNQGRTRDLVVQMHNEGNQPYEIEFDAISDGQRVLIVLYALLVEIAAAPRTVFLDEPENYVGLSELQPWLQQLDDALGDSGQLFLISHHPEVIDFLASEEPVIFERIGGGPVRVRSASFDRESGLKASELVARGLLDAH